MFDLDKMITEAYGPDLDKIISETYDSKAPMSIEKLSEMVENMLVLQESLGIEKILKEEQVNQVLQSAQKMAESEMPAEWHKLLPKIEISERWGEADSTGDNEARNQFETYMSAIGGSTVKEKLNNIATFVNNKTEDTDTRKVLSNIIFLDLLSTVVNNFSPSGAGFLFEAFLAGLLGGTQMVGKTEEGVLDIDDLVDAQGRPISLKLLTPTTGVKGSIENLLRFLARSSKAQEIGGGIIYLCVYKYGRETTKSLGFHEFTIDGENIYYWLADEFGFNTTLSDSKLNEAQFIKEPTVAGAIGVRGISKYDTLRRKQRENDEKIKKAVGMGINVRQLLGQVEKARDSFNQAAADSQKLAAYKTVIGGLGISIPPAADLYETTFTNKNEEQINDIFVARRELKDKINKFRAGKDDKKKIALGAMKTFQKDNRQFLTDFYVNKITGVTQVTPNLQPVIDQLTSPEAKRGMRIMRQVAQDYNYKSPNGLKDYSATELKNIGGQGIIDLLFARKKARTGLRNFVRPDNPYMGYFQQTYDKVAADYMVDLKDLNNAGTAEQTISYLKNLYTSGAPKSNEREEWLELMLSRYKATNVQIAIKKSGKKKKKKKNVKENILSESAETQFEINSDLITKNRLPKIYKHERLGVLKIDDESIKKLAASYAEGILRDIAKLFVALNKVTKGLTGYFLSDKDRFTSGSDAVYGMRELQEEITKQVKTSETE